MKNKKITITIAVIALISTFAYLRYLGNGWLSINKKTETTEIKEIKPDTTAVNSQQNTETEIPEVIKSIPQIQFKETGNSTAETT